MLAGGTDLTGLIWPNVRYVWVILWRAEQLLSSQQGLFRWVG